MARFSERYGYSPVKEVMQIESIDTDLRNGLWSAFYETIVLSGRAPDNYVYSHYADLLRDLWKKFFKLPIDAMPRGWSFSVEELRSMFYGLTWSGVYDFIEFVAQNTNSEEKSELISDCNEVLKREMAGYRFVNDEITQVTSNEEMTEIEQAINEASTSAVSAHLSRALELLSDKTEPDYRNSIKESISAVEALCANLTGDSSATLGQALKRLDADGAIKTHPALNSAFQKLYGYTSDTGGIRHALLEEDSLDFEDAKFMLVSCSAFVNYLQAKATKSI